MFEHDAQMTGCGAIAPTVKERCMRVLMAGLVAGLVAVPAAAPLQAFAQDGSITIEQRANPDATYKAYRVFSADIDEQDHATHVDWASSEVKAAVLAFLDGSSGPWASTDQQSYAEWLASEGHTGSGAHDSAQNAAEYIAAMIGSSEVDADAGTAQPTRLGWSFANMLARSLASSNVVAQTTVAGSTLTVPEGYYLFVSADSSVGSGGSGTAPIWVPVGGSVTTINAKEAVASVTFEVKDDRTGAVWGKAADANTGQDVEYRIVGTVPQNIKAYPSFHDTYVVALPAGVALASGDVSSVKVEVAGVDVTAKLVGAAGSISLSGATLTVDIADLTTIVEGASGADAVRDTALTKDSTVSITYSAHAVAGAVVGEAGNASTLTRTYTADPVGLKTVSAAAQTVKNYVYQARLVKVDKSTKEPLAGAKFSIKVANGNTDAASIGKYVQADGSLGDDAHLFETGVDGAFEVPGVDEGLYTIVEEGAPDGYELQDADIVLTVTSVPEWATGGLGDFSGSVTGGEAAVVPGDEATKFVSATKSAGVFELQAVDDRSFEMPVTGLEGAGALYAMAGVIGLAGAAGLAVSRRGDRSDRD